MIVKNEYVQIKSKDKNVKITNMILNKYLALFSKGQYTIDSGLNYDKLLSYCYIKIDEPIGEITPDKEFTPDNFDFYLTASSRIESSVEFNSNGCEITYQYLNDEISVLADFKGKKITALGFGKPQDIYAIVDTSNYELNFDDSSLFTIFRKDKFISDAVCSDKAYHLSPIGAGTIDYELNGTTYSSNVYSVLYSVGLGMVAGGMNQEFIVGKDVDINVIDDYSFSFNFKRGSSPTIYPKVNGHPSSSKYPIQDYVDVSKFPSEIHYPSSSSYPVRTDDRYIIYKFRNYYINRGDQVVYLDSYYTMSISISTRGLFEFATKIKRGDD